MHRDRKLLLIGCFLFVVCFSLWNINRTRTFSQLGLQNTETGSGKTKSETTWNSVVSSVNIKKQPVRQQVSLSANKDYEAIVKLFEFNHTFNEIKSSFSAEKLLHICKDLPESNIFGTFSAEIEPWTVTLLFHFVVIYTSLSPSLFCGVESLWNSLLNLEMSQPVELIIWFSEKEAMNSAVVSTLLFKLEVPTKPELLKIQIRSINFTNLFQGTPFEGFYSCIDKFNLNLGQFRQQNVGNAARLALLYKFGGFYLDLDFIVTKDISNWQDGFAKQSENQFNNAALKFTSDSSRLFLKVLMKRFVADYRDLWGYNGPLMINRVMRTLKQCQYPFGRKSLKQVDGYITKCLFGEGPERIDLKIWPTKDVYPIAYEDANRLLTMGTKNETSEIGLEDTTLIHLWSHRTSQQEAAICKKSWDSYKKTIIGALRRQYCPIVLSGFYDGANCLL